MVTASTTQCALQGNLNTVSGHGHAYLAYIRVVIFPQKKAQSLGTLYQNGEFRPTTKI